MSTRGSSLIASHGHFWSIFGTLTESGPLTFAPSVPPPPKAPTSVALSCGSAAKNVNFTSVPPEGARDRLPASVLGRVTRRLQASPDCLFCPAELRHPRAGFWSPWFPLRHESFVASLRLGGNQHLAVA